jgi:hypothetical protein
MGVLQRVETYPKPHQQHAALSSMKRPPKSAMPSAVKRMSSFSETEESEAELKVPEVVTAVKKEPVTFQKVMTRTITATLLSLFYLGLLQTGHLYCIISTVLIQVSGAAFIVSYNPRS